MSLPPSFNLLKQYHNPVFCETGTFRGDSLQLAIEAGFERIIGIDNDQESIDFCTKRFDLINKRNDQIKLFKGDSAVDLWSIIKLINQPILFFLDAHFQMIEGMEKGDNPFPLIEELKQIGKHPIKTHTIIIDDFLYLTHPDVTGWDKNHVFEWLRIINPNYQIKLIANPVINNMLVAWIP